MTATKGASTMELIDVPGTVAELGIDASWIRLAHSSTHLDRGLEPGEEVVLADANGALREAVVVDLDFELADTIYVLSLGGQIREGGTAADGSALSVESVTALLAELREQLRDDKD